MRNHIIPFGVFDVHFAWDAAVRGRPRELGEAFLCARRPDQHHVRRAAPAVPFGLECPGRPDQCESRVGEKAAVRVQLLIGEMCFR